MTKFKVWKIQHEAGDNPPWFTYSIKGESKPTIVTLFNFQTLFPDINLEDIPIAPETLDVKIKMIIKKKKEVKK